MTSLGSLVHGKPPSQPLNLNQVVTGICVAVATHNLTASITPGHATAAVDLGNPTVILAAVTAWTQQDDDAHEMCSLVACRSPLHPGPCKGWKGLLHSVSPSTYHHVEADRVKKANERRVKRIADLRSQGKPIPKRLLTEIKPKPAPNHPAPQHNAHNVGAVPLGQVGQKADLAGGQAHHASQAINKAAGVTPNQAPPLPTGPKGKKPSVAGRGPAFVITQPKVTDTYKLDKAAKITPQEWDALSGTDKKAIRDELEAIKQRGFGPQQTKADALLAKLPAQTSLGQGLANALGRKLAPGTPGTVTTPSGQVHQKINLPGKTSLGQATKTPQLPAPAPAPTRGTRDGNGILNKPHVGGNVTSTAVGLPKGYQITRDNAGYSLKHNGKLIRTSADQAALEKYAHDHAKGNLAGHAPSVQDKLDAAKKGAPGTPSPSTPAAPASSPGLKPSAPLAPGTAPHVQHAVAVANRTAPKASMGKTHVDAYGKLTKAEFDALPADKQKTIRDDLANAKAKFLDPKKQQAAADLLDRFGSRHPAPAAVPTAHPKGYSDPQNEVVKTASSGLVSTDDILKAVGRISPDQMKGLDDTDRQQVLKRLAFIATHPKATPEQKAKAAAFERIATGGTHVPASTKFDHRASIGELHAEEGKSGAAIKAVALDAANDPTIPLPSQRANRVKDLSGMSKAQFDSLSAADQRKVTDALHELHYTPSGPANNYTSSLDAAVGDTLTKYTGMHPGVHRLKQAEADFRAGKIKGSDVHTAFLHARVTAPATADKAARAAVEAEAARIAKDNPTLPTFARVKLAGDQKYGLSTYGAISLAGMEHNWKDAPRLSPGDFKDIFEPTDADLAASDPIHAQAVRDLQEHVLRTGLAPNSNWSMATKGHAVDALLGLSYSDTTVSPDRLKQFQALPVDIRGRVERVMRKRIDDQTDEHAKTASYLVSSQLEGTKFSPTVYAALERAADRYPNNPDDTDVYRKLDPAEYQALPLYAQQAIFGHLGTAQGRAQRSGAHTRWTPQDNPLKVMPAALAAHLGGNRTAYTRREERNASDIANYGTRIIDPFDRVATYNQVPINRFKAMSPGDQDAITADLDKISHDQGNTIVARFNAQLTHDVILGQASSMNVSQLDAVGAVNPTFGSQQNDATVIAALDDLDKADFDKLDPTFREVIDQRVMNLPGTQQQGFQAKFHPSVSQTANPSGVTPTSTQANVPPHVQAALDTIYGVHPSGKSHTMAHQLSTYGALRGGDFNNLNPQEQGHLLADLSFIATTAKGPSADKARKLIDRFTPPGTPSGQVPTGAIIPPANAVAGQVRYATPLKGLAKAKDSGTSGDGWYMQGGQRVWGKHGAAGLMLQHVDPHTGEKRYLMVQRGPAISDPGKWTFPGGASDSKETPHEGATRETIEELGLKDDVFKDALVHGDHTFTIPGSNWKYTSVAAQVPTMIKPNLSTAHARAETSDAKWMTLAEIQALDKAGKLHAPVANGKLEQNVLSLYPQGSGVTLGQVARPGPVTKRPGRLAMPPGGRQIPANFNAWPHAHKPSKGKDLIPDKAAQDAFRQKIKQDRKLYDGKTADGRLAAIGAAQGYDDTPTVLDKKEIDRLLATGDYIEAWRGVSGAGGNNWRSGSSGGKTAAQINEEMRSGPAYYGKGIFGNGYYLATKKSVAQQYADGTKGSISRILIPKSAVTQKYDKVKAEAFKHPARSQVKGGGSWDSSTLYDPGRYAAAKGIDGIEIEPHHVSPGGGARHVASPGKNAFNWLNRSVLIIQKEPG